MESENEVGYRFSKKMKKETGQVVAGGRGDVGQRKMKRPDGREDGKAESSSQCGICFENYCTDQNETLKKPIAIPGCQHSFCGSCWSRYIEEQVNIGALFTQTIRCMETSCRLTLNDQQIESILLMCHKNSAMLVARYKRLRINQEVRDDSLKIFCSTPGCEGILECKSLERRLECGLCRKLTCFRCKIPWHCGVTCIEFRMMSDEKKVALLGRAAREESKTVVTLKAASDTYQRCGGGNVFI
mmetsp:Transcript_808/g.1156  ORF Transcript_808/g.1156 Transcript_808/m.1156 type:complete len:243 (-) Transcript_808:4-732(-)